MHFFNRVILVSIAICSFVSAAPSSNKASGSKDRRSFVERDGNNFTIFEHAATSAKIEFVTNSGICETTPGVNQYSGYLSVGPNMNMWFWFFEARSNATTAPLATWFNGGPGCSSMIGLFQENGPCRFVNGSSTPTLNPFSFNNFANMLYIDQPIGTGFSYGDDEVNSTVTAAPYVWTLLQAFYAHFPQYENRDFGIFTESYGGHYGPKFAEYFESQNAAIASGTVQGEDIKLIALGINDGWFDAALQQRAFVDFAYNNTYKPLITAVQHAALTNIYKDRCAPALRQCSSSGSDGNCMTADYYCYEDIEGPLSTTPENGGIAAYDFDVYDIRQPSNDHYPPAAYKYYLLRPAVIRAIGAKSAYVECPDAPYKKFTRTGDSSRSFLSQLSAVVQSGVRTVIWAGDADFICNWFANLEAADAVNYTGTSEFNAAALQSYTVAGAAAGTFKTVDNLSFLRVFGAGHEVPYYQPAAALQVFKQTMQGQALAST